MALINKLTAIADAIRGKTGKTDEMTLDQMVTEIEGIQTGGGGDEFDSLVTRSLSGKLAWSGSKVGDYAFYGCNAITEVDIPNATEIGIGAFWRCSAITKVNAPSLVTLTQGANAGAFFSDCTNLTEFNAPNLEKVLYNCFANCKKISTFNFPKLHTIGNWGFASCGIEIANFPLVTSLRDRAFYGNSFLRIASLPKVDYGMDACFQYCPVLEYVILGNPTKLADNVFHATSTVNLVLPNKSKVTQLSNANGISPLVAIYVPSTRLADYKAGTNWANYADKIFAIEDNETVLGLLNEYGYEY